MQLMTRREAGCVFKTIQTKGWCVYADHGCTHSHDASVTFDDEFVVHDIKIVEGEKGYFVAMPNKKVGDSYKDVAHPLSAETRKKISDAIFEKYAEVAQTLPQEETSQE